MNGTRSVNIKSLHGFYEFKIQRFSDDHKDYFEAVNMYKSMSKDYESYELCAYRSEYANNLSYRKLATNLNHRIGDRGYSKSHLQKKIVETAVDMSTYQRSKYEGIQLCFPFIETDFNIYDSWVDEILLFEDGIGVKRQKDKRGDKDYEKPTKRVQSDIIAIEIECLKKKEDGQKSSTSSPKQGEDSQKPSTSSPKQGEGGQKSSTSSPKQGEDSQKSSTSSPKQGEGGQKSSVSSTKKQKQKKNYRYLSPLLDKQGNIALSMTCMLLIEWTILYQGMPKRLVVISDGAKNIRRRLEAVFGQGVIIILDWYHLKKRINEIMSMMGMKKETKKEHIKKILNHLWYGQFDQAIKYIKKLEPIKSRMYKKQELLDYLDKHQSEIINYQKRQQAGKSVGSGKAEITVNQVVGMRQKKKGMSWTPRGSYALGVIKTFQLNGQFNQFWNHKKAA